MRGLRSNLILLAVLLGLGAYVYFVASKEDTSTTTEKLFTSVEADSITELVVRSESGDVTTLHKEDGAWQIVAPVAARASESEASAIATGLASLNVAGVVDEAPTDLAQYGLAEPRIQVEFKSADGKTSGTVFIGSKNANGANVYARKDGETRVVMVPQYNELTFNQTTFGLRDKSVVSFDQAKVDGLDVTAGGTSFELAKKGGNWAITKPYTARADNSLADGLAGGVASLQMNAVAGTVETDADRKKFGLDRPSAVVNLHIGDDRATVIVGADAEDDTVYVRNPSRPDVVTVQKVAADDLRKPLQDYRRKDMFDMRAYNVTRIEVTRKGQTLVFEKVKGSGDNAADTWKRTSPTAAEPDKDKFETFVATLADIRASAFVDASARTGLDAPDMTVSTRFEDSGRQERVLFAKRGSEAFASRPDDPGAARIEAEKLDEVLASVDEFAK
ncbi:MAG: DUF4340 domain-containing protein [Vicinamibacterales bacterium]